MRAEKNYPVDTANTILLNKLSEQYLYEHADTALYFAKEGLRLAVFQKYTKGQALAWNAIGRAYYVQGNYSGSLDAATRLINISNQSNYRPGIAGAHQLMGLVYLAQDKNEPAADEFTKALKIYLELNDIAKAGKAYFDIGICYDESGRSRQAFTYLNKGIKLARQAKDTSLFTMILNRMGEAWFHLKKYDKALNYYQQVAKLNFANNWERGFAYSGAAQTYYAMGKYNDAITNAQKGYDLSNKVNSASDVARALEILAESYAATNDFKQAYTYQVHFKKLNDSIFNSEKEMEVNSLHLKQQQADNKQLKKDIENKEQAIALSKRLLWFRNMIAVVVVTFFIFVFINNRQKTALNKTLVQQNNDIALQKEEISRQKEVLDQLNSTKDKLFSVISHDLRSPFAAILQSIDAIRSGDISGAETELLLDDFYRQVSQVTTMVNNLLAWANSQQLGITTNPVTLDVVETVKEIVSVSGFLAKHKNIAIEHRPDDGHLIIADADHVRIILQNLVANAIKFTRQAGTITIYYSDDKNYVAVHVKDTGTGIPAEKMDKIFKVAGKEVSGYGTNNEAGAGIGLALIKQFTDANDGKLEVETQIGQGSEFTVYFKKA